MAFHIAVHPAAELVVLVAEGAMTTQDFLDATDCYLADPNYRPHFQGVADLRRAEFDVKSVDYRRISQYVINSGRVLGRWVCLVRRPVETAMTILYAGAVDEAHEIKTFFTLAAAAGYLGIDLLAYLDESEL